MFSPPGESLRSWMEVKYGKVDEEKFGKIIKTGTIYFAIESDLLRKVLLELLNLDTEELETLYFYPEKLKEKDG